MNEPTDSTSKPPVSVPPVEPRPVFRHVHRDDRRFIAWNNLQTIIAAAVIIATLFTMWNPANLFSNKMFNQTWRAIEIAGTNLPAVAGETTPTTSMSGLIGIVAGHYSADPDKHDPGAVCPDGLEEEQVNYDIAYLVYQKLTELGFQVDLLQEWDPKLMGYKAMAVVSVHNDTCQYVDDNATGFKVASAIASAIPENDARLTNCLIDRYQKATGMKFHYNTITTDMTYYHNFYEINSQTPAAIIETGFLNLDRAILTGHKDIVAQGIVDGIMCYIRNESVTPFQIP